jgi:cell wall-associated NlpC family hydrolase
MAVPAIAKAALRVLAVIWPKADKDEQGESAGGILKAVVICGAVVLVMLSSALTVISPFGLYMATAEAVMSGSGEGGVYDISEMDGSDITDIQVHRYVSYANALKDWAKQMWPDDGGGRSVYITPDWRYLYALDSAMSENDMAKVEANAESYEEMHKNLLTAKRNTWVEEVVSEVEEGTKGAWQGEDGGWYVTEYVYRQYWAVGHKSYKNVFASLAAASSGIISAEARYYIYQESGEYGQGWGDGGNALGAWQFDRRYALTGFLPYCYDADPNAYAAFKPYIGRSIAQGDSGLEAAWIAAYNADPERFVYLQDQYEYDNYFAPAQEIAARYGIDTSSRRDCIKGLFAGITNLFGRGGAATIISGSDATDEMDDMALAEAICSHIIGTWPQYANRYTEEIDTIRWYLSQEPAVTEGNVDQIQLAWAGQALTTELKAAMCDYHYRALSCITVQGDRVMLDPSRFYQYLSGDSTSSSSAGETIVEAAKSQLGVPYVWGGTTAGVGLDCSGLTQWCYAQAGIDIPRVDTAQHEAGVEIPLDEAEPGDILWKYGHVAIYVGGDEYIHAPQPGDVVRYGTGIDYFTCAVRY